MKKPREVPVRSSRGYLWKLTRFSVETHEVLSRGSKTAWIPSFLYDSSGLLPELGGRFAYVLPEVFSEETLGREVVLGRYFLQ